MHYPHYPACVSVPCSHGLHLKYSAKENCPYKPFANIGITFKIIRGIFIEIVQKTKVKKRNRVLGLNWESSEEAEKSSLVMTMKSC